MLIEIVLNSKTCHYNFQCAFRFKLNLDDTKMLLKTMRSNKTADIGCPAASVQCSELSKFRSINGTCNNVAHPHWGEQSTLFNRLLPPAYSNGCETLYFDLNYFR